MWSRTTLLLLTLLSSVNAAELSFYGIGVYQDQDTVMVAFDEALREDERVSDLIEITSGGDVLSEWVLSEHRRFAWLKGTQPGAEYRATLRDEAQDRNFFTNNRRRLVTLGAQKPSIEVLGSGPMLLPSSKALPIKVSNVEAVFVDLYRVANPQTALGKLNPFEGLDGNTIDALGGALEWIENASYLVENLPRNRSEASMLPLNLPSDGWYVVGIRPSKRFGHDATVFRHVVRSNLNLSAMVLEKGVAVWVNDLSTGQAIEGASVSVIDKDGAHTATTDGSGTAFVDGQFTRQVMIEATAQSSHALLPMNLVAIDLSDFNVDGGAQRPIEAYITSNRDLIAPGDQLQISAILRGVDGVVPPAQPLQFKLRDPDGTTIQNQTLPSPTLGFYNLNFNLTEDAKLGAWVIEARTDPKGEVIGQFVFRVDDFVPERFEVSVTGAAPILSANQSNTLNVAAQYLVGGNAAGANLDYETEYTSAFSSAVADWNIGVRNPLYQTQDSADQITLDRQGEAALEILKPDEGYTAPISIRHRISVSDSGSKTTRNLTTQIWPSAKMLGIKNRYGRYAPYDTELEFDVAWFDLGQPAQLEEDVDITVFRESSGYYVYSDSEGWVYRNNTGDQPILFERTQLDGEHRLKVPVTWGDYILRATGVESGTTSEIRFYAGWGANSVQPLKPTGLDANLLPNSDQSFQLQYHAPYAGQLRTTLISNGLEQSNIFKVEQGQGEHTLVLNQAIERQDTYLLITLMGQVEGKPARSVAVIPLNPPRQDRKIEGTLSAPALIKPNSSVKIEVSASTSDTSSVVLMIADNGVRNITGYEVTDPLRFTYRRRKLGGDWVDLFDRFYDVLPSTGVTLRSGGDQILKKLKRPERPSDQVTFLTVTAPIQFEQGKAVFELITPDFNGEITLSALIQDGNRLGLAETTRKVRNPISLEFKAPPQMRVGDSIDGRIRLQSALETPTKVTLSTTTTEGLDLTLEQTTFTLAKDEQVLIPAKLSAAPGSEVFGTQSLSLRVEHDDQTYTTTRQIWLQPLGEWQRSSYSFSLLPGEALTLGDAPSWLSGGTRVLSAGNILAMPIDQVLSNLMHFGFYCTEQTVSGALPLLLEHPSIETAAEAEGGKEQLLRDAISILMRRQQSDGSFSLWDNGETDAWASVYATDFLAQVAQKYPGLVDDAALEYARQFLQRALVNSVDTAEYLAQIRAYAGWVLVRDGKANLATLQQAYESVEQTRYNATDYAHWAQAFYLAGDTQRAIKALDLALGYQNPNTWRYGYGSDLADDSKILQAMKQMQQAGWKLDNQRLNTALQSLRDHYEASRDYLSTQTSYQLINTLMVWRDPTPLRIGVNTLSETFKGTTALEIEAGTTVVNQSEVPLFFNDTYAGYTKDPVQATGEQLKVSQRYYDLEGKPLDLASISAGQQVFVVSDIKNNTGRYLNIAFADDAPAGFVVDNPGVGRNVATPPALNDRYTFAQADQTRYTEARYSAALGMGAEATLVYKMQALTSGDMYDPPATVEDMYQPDRNAVGQSMGWLRVNPR